jgi:hypothetical protein
MTVMRSLSQVQVHEVAKEAGIRVRLDFPENGGTEVCITTDAADEEEIIAVVVDYLTDSVSFSPRSLYTFINYTLTFGGQTNVFLRLA